MSATATPATAAALLQGELAELKSWRDGAAAQLAAFRRWAVVARVLDEHSAARLAHLERRLQAERLTIAFVAEYSRGKSELINALFFADLGSRLLPSGVGRTTLCPTEILWDASRAPSLRLLPIETRASPEALREFAAKPEAWHEVAFDPAKTEEVTKACEALSETLTVSADRAADLGIVEDAQGEVEIPRWRYAMLNLPHPVLRDGLIVLDTPGHNTMGSEPELTMHRIPDAAAVVFLLGADTGVTRTDRELWSEHIEPVEGLEQNCFVVLNKIDGLRDGFKPETQVLAEIDRQVRSTAEELRIDPMRVFAISARQGLVGKIQGDRDSLIRSRLYRLEQALAQGMAHRRRVDHASAVRAETRSAFQEGRGLLESRLAFARQQLEELGALQGKNQKLVETLARKAASERARLEQARSVMIGLRTEHHRHADELARLLDPNSAREQGIQARRAVLASKFSSGIGDALDGYFRVARERIREAIEHIVEARSIMGSVARRFNDEFHIPTVELGEFATERFLVELDRLEERCARDFKGATSLLTRRRSTLSALFFDSVALKVIHIFEVADREVRTWMNGFVRPLDAQLTTFQEQANSRIEGMARIQNAETDLVTRVAELRALAEELEGQLEEWEVHHEHLMATLDVPEATLA